MSCSSWFYLYALDVFSKIRNERFDTGGSKHRFLVRQPDVHDVPDRRYGETSGVMGPVETARK